MNLSWPTILRSIAALWLLSGAAGFAQAQTLTGDVRAGQQRAEMCIGCHGVVGYQNSFPEIHKVPKISGQSAPYIVSSLRAYQTGQRRHPTMRGIASALSEQEMADLAAFYASHSDKKAAAVPRSASVEVAALLEKGACMVCHGANFSQPIEPNTPKIGGQHADYLFVALRAYTVEGNRVVGRASPVMSGIAKRYTLAELRAMAAYLASVEGELSTVPQPGFR